MQSCVSRNGVNPQGLFGLYPRKREYLGGCESADHPKITPTAEDVLRPNYLFGSGSVGLGVTSQRCSGPGPAARTAPRTVYPVEWSRFRCTDRSYLFDAVKPEMRIYKEEIFARRCCRSSAPRF